MTAQIVLQVLLSGLLMGLIYALVASGLALIFGLMDVVNFAHGDFLMVAMYAMFVLVAMSGADPLLLAPAVTLALFAFGAAVYLGIVRFAMRVQTNRGMVQVFTTFGLGLLLQGLAQTVFTPDYRSVDGGIVAGRSVGLGGIILPMPHVVGALISLAAFGLIWLLINRTDLGKALEATREDADAVALVGIDKNRVFAIGWGLGSALVGLSASILATFFYIFPGVGNSFVLIAFVTVALGGFGSVYGALAAGVLIGLIEAMTALLVAPSLKMLGVFAVYLAVVTFRPRGLFGSM